MGIDRRSRGKGRSRGGRGKNRREREGVTATEEGVEAGKWERIKAEEGIEAGGGGRRSRSGKMMAGTGGGEMVSKTKSCRRIRGRRKGRPTQTCSVPY